MADGAFSKGVMLCDRPPDPPKMTAVTQYGPTKAPFLSACTNSDPLGIAPVNKPSLYVASQRKLTVLSEHKSWLAHQSKKVKSGKQEQLATTILKENKEAKHKEFCANLRSKILDGEDVTETWVPAKEAKRRVEMLNEADKTVAKHKDCSEIKPPLDDVTPLDAEMADLIEGALLSAELGNVKKQPPAQPSGDTCKVLPTKKNTSAKPAWALTEQKASEIEEDEELELLNFVDNLDYEKYMEEDEGHLSTAINALAAPEVPDSSERAAPKNGHWDKNFVRAMNALVNIEAAGSSQASTAPSVLPPPAYSESKYAQSTVGSRAREEQSQNRSVGQATSAWDASTRVGDGEGGTKPELATAVKIFLDEDRDMRKIHSSRSARRLLETAPTEVAVEEF
ncbi:hypothetical protein CYMTET_9127 [Cymbomonas tetramitiformis]|uniref:Uncharacterized protein n=1 Tax=Cymbomonas tetramitiformis TaxID=36881 RepID=A0AAE0LFS9_9CHLO|nr:hypothetical protein CYMTET_9127 [Cymbomonas tetramitiformis]|eukprot:gene19711-23580_t